MFFSVIRVYLTHRFSELSKLLSSQDVEVVGRCAENGGSYESSIRLQYREAELTKGIRSACCSLGADGRASREEGRLLGRHQSIARIAQDVRSSAQDLVRRIREATRAPIRFAEATSSLLKR
jgi:hypothetical protein